MISFIYCFLELQYRIFIFFWFETDFAILNNVFWSVVTSTDMFWWKLITYQLLKNFFASGEGCHLKIFEGIDFNQATSDKLDKPSDCCA